jgi:hydrogenase maturation protease
MGGVVIAGLGSEYRRDDGVGPLVARRVAELVGSSIDVGPLSDPLDLLGPWDQADLAVVVDAVRSGMAPGTVRCVELASQPVSNRGDGIGAVLAGEDRGGPGAHGGPATSTHGIGLAGVLRLARAVGRAPTRVVVVGIDGQDFGSGIGLTPEVEAAVPGAVRRVLELIAPSSEGVQPCA